MATAVTLSVAVWEYVRFSGTWTAYPPDACEKLERARIKSESKDETKVPIDISCRGVKAHFVDVVKMQQVFGDEQDHCAASPVRRNLYPLDSAPAKGVNWEWRTNSGKWYPYSVHLSCLIEKAKEHGLPKINLQDHYPECIYTVEFTTMHQRNNFTSFCRVIRRVEGKNYPLAPDAITCPEVNLNVPERKANPMELTPPVSDSNSSDVTVIAQIFPKKRKGRRSNHTASFAGIPCTSEGASDTKSLKTEGCNSLDGIKLPNNSWTDSVQDTPEPEEFLARHIIDVTGTVPAEDCSICCEPLVASSSYNSCGRVVRLSHCTHYFHYACLAAMYKSNPKTSYLQCPVCKAIYGVKQGNQPPGIMNFQVLPFTLPGYEGCGTIQITYHIPSGVQGPEHPRPGMPYTARGFPRHGYLPNNDQGRKALKLLVDAWDRRLIFTIGQSTTTGEQDTVTWNEIHHKTECGSNHTGHGFPDPSYLDNLFAELRVHGVAD
ncbi:E3 ubiquitin-protein ligase DTX4-like [Dermacentor variabilis]|uniref:E3 ubiquitin-protein ligase DTX4-like n=1 Tax=Dermacentor variabilis TaxID=34621 RepID=UPI003F5C4F40